MSTKARLDKLAVVWARPCSVCADWEPVVPVENPLAPTDEEVARTECPRCYRRRRLVEAFVWRQV